IHLGVGARPQTAVLWKQRPSGLSSTQALEVVVSWDPGTIEKLFAAPDGTPPPVPHTEELDRILALPRRKFDPTDYPDMTALFALPGGTLQFRPLQSAMLWE